MRKWNLFWRWSFCTWSRSYQCSLSHNFSSLIRRDRTPWKTRKDVIRGEAIFSADPARTFTGLCSSARRVESSAIVENRGILLWMSSKKIKTLRKRRRSCQVGWSSPLAKQPLCAIRRAPKIRTIYFLIQKKKERNEKKGESVTVTAVQL